MMLKMFSTFLICKKNVLNLLRSFLFLPPCALNYFIRNITNVPYFSPYDVDRHPNIPYVAPNDVNPHYQHELSLGLGLGRVDSHQYVGESPGVLWKLNAPCIM